MKRFLNLDPFSSRCAGDRWDEPLERPSFVSVAMINTLGNSSRGRAGSSSAYSSVLHSVIVRKPSKNFKQLVASLPQSGAEGSQCTHAPSLAYCWSGQFLHPRSSGHLASGMVLPAVGWVFPHQWTLLRQFLQTCPQAYPVDVTLFPSDSRLCQIDN